VRLLQQKELASQEDSLFIKNENLRLEGKI
jgi:hypothetical protein